jgi:hypothetical protein
MKITKTADLAFDKLRLVFLMAIRDFKEGKIKLEELSLLAAELVQMPQENDDPSVKKLKEVIHLCSEIIYYLRQIPEVDKDGKITISFLVETMEYFEQNKDLLD